MKYLYIICVLTPSLAKKAKKATSFNFLNIIEDDLKSGGNCVIYYQPVFDGWDATDRIIGRWMELQYNNAFQKFRLLNENHGQIHLSYYEDDFDFLLTMTYHQIQKVFTKNVLNNYAINIFMSSFQTGIIFKKSTKCPLIIQRILVGNTINDESYNGNDIKL